MSISLQLYIIGGLEILLPIIFLLLLGRSHKFRISSVISGIGGYFLVNSILMGSFMMFLSSFGLNEQFWQNHKIISEVVYLLFTVVFQNATIFLIMKYVLKKKIRIYDGIALGVSYWLFYALNTSTSAVSYARVASMASEGRLSEMVTDTLPLETLQEYADMLNTVGISSFYIQLLGIVVLSVMTAMLCVFLFHGVKRGNLKFLWMTMGMHLVLLAMLNFSSILEQQIWYCIAAVVVAAASVVIFLRYWSWYKEQQAELLRKKQEYAQRQKAMTGNVVSIKPAEDSADTESKPE